MSSKWKEFGDRLDIPANRLEAWEKEHRGVAAECWRRVVCHWLENGGPHDYPTTWNGLYALLEDIELAEVSKKLKEAVSCSCKSE